MRRLRRTDRCVWKARSQSADRTDSGGSSRSTATRALQRQAALADMGTTILPEHHVSADLMSGALLQLPPDYRIKGADNEVSLAHPGHRHVSAKTRSFVEFAVDYFRNRARSTLSSIFTNS
ncbi:LysR substrate-binding domain-containing protein [Paraburkholderia sediminicola]|uniref:LysR substrate-binding domain-containing protein n=1 Tax=Paraburkholderia sediminicola TaxID=458836 RepID=UPI0038B6BA08